MIDRDKDTVRCVCCGHRDHPDAMEQIDSGEDSYYVYACQGDCAEWAEEKAHAKA